MVKKTYKVSGMHCPSCAMVIEADLEDAGIKASCSYAQQTLDVESDESLINEEKIKQAVFRAGYSLGS